MAGVGQKRVHRLVAEDQRAAPFIVALAVAIVAIHGGADIGQAGKGDEIARKLAGKRRRGRIVPHAGQCRSEEHTSELQSLMRISYAVFCLKNKNTTSNAKPTHN